MTQEQFNSLKPGDLVYYQWQDGRVGYIHAYRYTVVEIGFNTVLKSDHGKNSIIPNYKLLCQNWHLRK